MNAQVHSLIYDLRRRMCVAVAETVRRRGKPAGGEGARAARRRAGRTAGGSAVLAQAVGAVTLALMSSGAPVRADGLPSGASVVQGAAQIRSDGTAMRVQQQTSRLVTDWQQFSIGAGRSVQFVQPSSSSVALNRVTGSEASRIFGSLTANGHVYLQNAAGVLFAPGAQVDVGSLVATTLRFDLDAFAAGRIVLGGNGGAAGAVQNFGMLRAAPGGSVLLAGPQVAQHGTIEAPGGQVGLVAAQGLTVDPTGNGLLDIRITAAALGAQLQHSGRSVADGGAIALQAAALDAARRSVMQVDGVLRAQRVEQRGGTIVLAGGAQGAVRVGAALDASSADGAGGSIRVLGDAVALVGGAALDASGAGGGGEILVGGNVQGRGPEPNARATFVGRGVTLDASATQQGDGGRVVVWSDGHTAYGGELRATGGAAGGDGGFAEVSGKQTLDYQGGADLRAAHGRTGTLLLDPDFIVVGDIANLNGDGSVGDDLVDDVLLGSFAGATSRITATRLADQLASADVTLQASIGIDVDSPVSVSATGADTLLTLDAPAVSINAPMTLNRTALAIQSSPGSFDDSVFIDGHISTQRSLTIDGQSITLWASATLSADTVTLRSTVDGAGSVFQRLTNSIIANSAVFGAPGARFDSVDLNGGNNQMRAVSFQASGAAHIQNANSGWTFPISGSAASLNLQAGTGVTQSAPLTIAGAASLTTTGAGSMALNNAGNTFGGVVDVYATGDLSLRAAGDLSVRGVANGNAVLVAGGVFTLAGDLTAYGSTGIDITGAGFDNSGNWDLTTPNGFFYVTSSDYTKDDLGDMTFGGVVYDGDCGCYVSTPSQFNFISFNYPGAAWVGGKFASNGNGYFTNRPATLDIVEPVGEAYTDYNGSTDNYTGMYLGAGTTFAPVSGSELYYVYGRSLLDDKNAGTEKGFTLLSGTDNVAYGLNGTRYYGLDLSGYVRPPGPPTSGYGESTVFPANLYLEGLFADKTYDGTVTATLDGVAYVTPYGSDDVVLDGSPTVGDFADKNVGYKTLIVSGLSISGADANNYTFIPEIYPYIYQAPLEVTGITPVNKVYDGSTYINFSGTPVLAPALGSDDVTLVDIGIGFVGTKNVGTGKFVNLWTYQLGGVDGGNYYLTSPVALTVDITPATLAVTGVSALGKVYDGSTSATLSGTAAIAPVSGDVVSLTGTPTATFDSKNVGLRSVDVVGYSLTGTDAANYVIDQPGPLSATITAATLTLSGVSALDKVYDATTAATLTGTPTVTPFGSDVVTIGGSVTADFADKNVGSGKAVSVSGYTLGGADGGNYTLELPTQLTASITPATLALTGLIALDKVYDATTAAALSGTPSVTALGSDVVSLSGTGSASFADKNVGTAKSVTVSGYTLGGADAGNYTLAGAGGLSADITPYELTLAGLSGFDKVYDGTTAATLTGTPTIAALGSDVVTLTGSGSASFADKNVGADKPLTISGYTLGGADAGNYTLLSDSGATASITPALLAIGGLSALDKVYDATTSATISGTPSVVPIGADDVTVSGTAAGAFADKNVGTAKPIVLSGLTLGGVDAGNYTPVAPSDLSADITPAALSLAGLTAFDKVYDGTTAATLSGTPTLTALANDVVTLVGGGSASFADKNVGTGKAVSVSGYTLGGADGGNYTLLADSGATASITPALLSIDGLVAIDKVYDATTSATISGTATATPIGADAVTVDGSAAVGSFADKNVGSAKPIVLSGLTLGGADGGNYTPVASSSLTAAITPAPLVIGGLTVLDKVYDATTDATLSGTPSYTPLGSDVVTVIGSGGASFVDKNVGSAKSVLLTGLTLGGTDGANYTAVAPTALTASITPLPLSLSVTTADKVYDGTTAATAAGMGSGTAALAGDSVSFVIGTLSFADKNVGVQKTVFASGFGLTGPDASNYTLSPVEPSSASITPLALDLTGLVALDKVYDRTTAATLTGSPTVTAIGTDEVVVSGSAVGEFVSPGAASAVPVTVSGLSLSGADAGNYTLVSEGALAAAITPAPLLLAGLSALDKVYDATTVAALTGTPTVSPIEGDSVTVGAFGAGSFADKNVGTAKSVTIGTVTLAGPDAANYTVVGSESPLAASITPATLTLAGITVLDKVYDKTAAATLAGASVTPLAGDAVSVVGLPAASFSDVNVGSAIPVTVDGSFVLGGADAGNYVLDPALPPLTGAITPRGLVATGIVAIDRPADGVTLTVDLDTRRAGVDGVLPGDTVALEVTPSASGLVESPEAGRDKPVGLLGLALTGPDARNYILLTSFATTATRVSLLTPLETAFEDLRFNEYLQAVSDAQEPFRRAMAEALAAGFGKENIRKRLALGLVYETGLAPPAVDEIEPARAPQACNAGGAAGSPLACP